MQLQGTEQALINELTSCFAACDAVIVSDYGYGILTAGVIAAITKPAFLRPSTVVDSKNLTAYGRVTAVKQLQRGYSVARCRSVACHISI